MTDETSIHRANVLRQKTGEKVYFGLMLVDRWQNCHSAAMMNLPDAIDYAQKEKLAVYFQKVNDEFLLQAGDLVCDFR